MGEWEEQNKLMEKPARNLSDQSFSYMHINCSNCHHSPTCSLSDFSSSGCKMRKEIYDNLFSEIRFKYDDAIAMNRLRLLSKYYVELMLKRTFGEELTPVEVILLKTTLSELSKLSIDKKGELVDQKAREVVPWELDENVIKIKNEIEEARKMKMRLKGDKSDR